MAKKLRGRRTALSLLAAASLGAMMMAPAGAAFAASPTSTQLAGNTRYGTAVKIAEQMYPGGPSSHTIVITSGADANLVDALTAAPLARALHAPILLAQSPTELGPDVLNYISANGITKVVLIGAVGANASTIESQLPSGVSVVGNYSGATRFQTAAAIAEALLSLEGKTSFSTVFVASGEQNNLIDALAGDPVAARMGAPILLAASSGSILPSTREQNLLSSSSQQFVLGAAASYPVTATMTGAVKLYGSSRFSTATAIDEYSGFVPSGGYSTIVVANGSQNHLVDAIAGGPLAAKDNAALVLVNDSAIPGSTSLFLQNSQYDQASTVLVLGGPASIPSQTVNAINGAVNAATTQQQVASSVTLTPTNTSVVADGSATDVVKVAVLDANGKVDTAFNGTVTVTDTQGQLVEASGATGSTLSVDITNGTGSLTIQGNSGLQGQTDTLSTNNLQTTNGAAMSVNVQYGTTTVSDVAPQAASLSLSTNVSAISANSSSTAVVTATVEDQAGNPFPSYSGPITYTINGPATFTSNNSQTYTTYITGGSEQVTIAAEQGVTGTITVTATSGNLKAGSVSLPAVINTAAANIKVSATSGTDKNTNEPTTVYTVQLVDTNGNPITTSSANDTVTVSDNASSLNGAITYYQDNNGQPGAKLGTDSFTANLVNGQLQFVAEASTAFTGAATITITDTSNPNGPFTQTETFTPAAGSAYAVAVTDGSASSLSGVTDVGYLGTSATPNLAIQSVEAGASVTFTAQLIDYLGLPVSKEGIPVTFTLSSNGAGATFPNGSSSQYVAETGADGKASVTLNVPSSAPEGAQVVVTASFQGSKPPAASTTPAGVLLDVVSPLEYATQVTVDGKASPAPLQISADETGLVTLESVEALDNSQSFATSNAAPAGTDLIQVTSSNPGVVKVAAGYSAQASSYAGSVTVKSVYNGSYNVALIGTGVGTATLTFTDLSAVGQPSVTQTVTVQAGTPTQVQLFDSANNDLSTSATGDTVPANSGALEVNLALTDAAGDIVPADATYYVYLPSITGLAWRLNSASGATPANNVVTFQPGQSTQTLYLVNGTGSPISVNETNVAGSDFTIKEEAQLVTAAPTSLTFSSAGTQYVTVAVYSSGSPSSSSALAGQTVYWLIASGGSGLAIANGSAVTNASGEVTIPVTVNSVTSGATDTLKVFVGSINAVSTTVTIYD
ncbi:MAG: cell wall-binding repeat-containing protein [Firmicutes bacterium]|nr:cell wall-binding repeat-containing protein [Bacillota bacterium]